MRTPLTLLPVVFVLVTGCPSPAPPEAPPVAAPLATEPPPVDPSRVALPKASAWGVQRSLRADLDADGADERLVLAADAATGPDGQPLWDDGQRWAAWVVDADAAGDSVQTLLYGAYVQLGHVDVSVLVAPPGEAPAVLVLEQMPPQLRALTVRYDGPGAARGAGETAYRINRSLSVR